MRLHTGTSGYAYRAWKPAFYPPDLPASRFLPHYAAHFPTVEINGTFYRMPTEANVRAMADQVPSDFLFSFKAPQAITHIRRLRGVAAPVRAFDRATAVLKERRGVLLFQLPPFLKVDVPLLEDFLAILPKTRCALEFRHPSWFDDCVFDLLRGAGAALCLNDADVDGCPVVDTAGWGYLRLRRVVYTPTELRAWRRRIAAQPWTEAFVYFKHEDTATGPRLAAALAASGKG